MGSLANVFAFIAVEIDRDAVDQIDHALKARFGADGKLKRNGRQPQLGFELLDHVGGVGPGSVHLVDERDARDRITLHLAIDGDRLRLHAGHGAEHEHRAIQNAERPLHLDREINVPRRVDDVDLVVVPVDGGRGRGDRDAALALQVHVVHHGTLTLDFLDGMGAARVIQDPLGQRGLARIDVRRDSNVPYVAKVFHIPIHSDAVQRVERPLFELRTTRRQQSAGIRSTHRSRDGLKGMPGRAWEAHQNRSEVSIT